MKLLSLQDDRCINVIDDNPHLVNGFHSIVCRSQMDAIGHFVAVAKSPRACLEAVKSMMFIKRSLFLHYLRTVDVVLLMKLASLILEYDCSHLLLRNCFAVDT